MVGTSQGIIAGYDGSHGGKQALNWALRAAQKRGVPAFTVMHDTSLDDLCRIQPVSVDGLRGVHGFGPRKTELYGREIVSAIREFQNRVSQTPRFKGPETKRPTL